MIELVKSKWMLFNVTNINFCHMKKYQNRNIFLSSFLDANLANLRKNLSCPFRAGLYVVEPRNVTDLNSFVKYIPPIRKTLKTLEYVKIISRIFTKIRNQEIDLLKVDDLFKTSW